MCRPIFVISDLHMGDGGEKDEFAGGTGRWQLELFLNHVVRQQGELVILGDLFNFGETDLSEIIAKVIALATPWLNRFEAMGATYVIGNHDDGLKDPRNSELLAHPFFGTMSDAFERRVCGKRFRFMHGHEIEPRSFGYDLGWQMKMIELYRRDKETNGYDVAIVGHTHRPGRIGDWYFNSGMWFKTKNSFVQISSAGNVAVFDWVDGQPQPNPTILDTN